MAFFSNKRKDFSIQPPKQEIANGAFSVIDSANIDFTYANNDLTANLTNTGVVAGTYGDATNIPVLQIDQWGRVTGVTTIAIGGGGGTYTVNNGLTENPANNFQWGGPLIQNTLITQGAYTVTFDQNNFGLPSMIFNQSGILGIALKAIALQGSALQGFTTNGTAIVGTDAASGIGGTFSSSSNYGLSSTTGSGIAAIYGFANGNAYGGHFQRQASLNVNLITGVLKVKRNQASPASVPDVGYGASIDFFLGYNGAATGETLAANISILWTDPLLASKTSQYRLELYNNGTKQEVLNSKGTGQLQLNNYTGTTFDASPTKSLGVDVNGNVITFTASPVSGDSISPFLLMGG